MSRKHPRDRRVKMLKLWLRGLRKMSRQIEDAKKREERDGMKILDKSGRVVVDKGFFAFERYCNGRRRGTIL